MGEGEASAGGLNMVMVLAMMVMVAAVGKDERRHGLKKENKRIAREEQRGEDSSPGRALQKTTPREWHVLF